VDVALLLTNGPRAVLPNLSSRSLKIQEADLSIGIPLLGFLRVLPPKVLVAGYADPRFVAYCLDA
jgi:hypothetical protein